jgi:outer membrane lipoprotein SlyB
METQINNSKFSPALMWTAGVAIIVFCAAGVGAIMGWIPTSMGQQGDAAAIEKQASASRAAQPAQRPAVQAPRAPVQVASAPVRSAPAPARCAECGVIESSREISTKSSGSGLGAVGGAVVGGILGHQVGGGRGQDVATVVGAVGGAVAGNEIEKRAKANRTSEVTVRMEDGSSRVIQQASASTWRNGDRVRVVDGAIRAN